ncbi:MAG: ankyrin repeat domain-containing protein [Saprospiraceae bacterium]
MEYDSDIFDAVEFGDLKSVKRHWTKEINVNFQDENGISLIMLASRYNHKDIVNHLLTLKPNLYLKNKEGETVFQIAGQLKDKEIFKTITESCWKEGEKIFLFEYHAEPKFETELVGAYINCWIMDEDFNNAKSRSLFLIKEENWGIDSIEDISEIEKGTIEEKEDNFKFYEQVIIDKEVLVFYTYDSTEEE